MKFLKNTTNRRRYRFLKLAVVSLLGWTCLITKQATAGKTAARSGAIGAVRYDGKEFSKNKDLSTMKSKFREGEKKNSSKTLTTAQKLKAYIFEGYDSTLMPVENYTDNVHVSVDFTYRQVLDLDEKNQILKSLIWFRYKWTDEHLNWKPVDYDNIKEIEVPHNLIWRPDVVMFEEIGVRDYTPRLQKVKINHTGEVKYNEPCVFETTCSIDTAFFPFDQQICYMTFVTWSQPITEIDLTSEKDSTTLLDDAMHYFVNTGEWQLHNISVTKTIRDYDKLLSHQQNNLRIQGAATQHTKPVTNKNDIAESQLPPRKTATKSLVGRDLTKTMFAEIKFTITVRRNSSLYMQSMLFPSILLTTVAILGFYLPPDSGERIGLQITILLTFMVFLLAVGEMFPASTGPYLGIYFVLCMGLLGLNLAMTVVVLHLHFKPVIDINFDVESKYKQENLQQTENFKRLKVKCCGTSWEDSDEFVHTCDKRQAKKSKSKSAVPRRLRYFLQFFNRYWSVKEQNARWMYVTSDEEENDCTKNDSSEDEISSLVEEESCTPSYDHSWTDSRREKIVKTENEIPSITVTKRRLSNERPDLSTQRRFGSESHIPQLYSENLATSSNRTFTADQKDYNHHTSMGQGGFNNNSTEHVLPNLMLAPDFNMMSPFQTKSSNNARRSMSFLSPWSPKKSKNFAAENKTENSEHNHPLRFPMMSTLNDIKEYIKKNDKIRRKKRMSKKRKKRELKKRLKDEQQERIDTEQEEWKSVARAIDVIFFRMYVMCIIVSHTTLLGVALNTWINGHG